jgi:hypothetical protein
MLFSVEPWINKRDENQDSPERSVSIEITPSILDKDPR